MNVHSMVLGAISDTHYQSLVGLQLGIDFESQGSHTTIPLTSALSGDPVRPAVFYLFLNNAFLAPIRITWDPPDFLRFANPGASFPSLDNLLVANNVARNAAGRIKGTVTVDLLDATGHTAKSASQDFFIFEKALTMSPGGIPSVNVGDTLPPGRQITDGSKVYFDPAKAFSGVLSLRQISDQSCDLTQIRQPPDADALGPANMNYSWGPAGSGPPLRFEVPKSIRLNDESSVQFGAAGMAIVHARSAGIQTLTTKPSIADNRFDFPPLINAQDRYTVQASKLATTFTPAVGDNRNGKLLFEDRWVPLLDEPHGGRLVSSFLLEVKRNGNEVIYRSSDPAILELEVTPSRLHVKSIARIDDKGLRTIMPFQLAFSSSNDQMVQFWLPSEDQGKPQVKRTLDDIMAAVGYGQPCEIRVKLLPIPNPGLEVDVYSADDLPAAQTLEVVIPGPLEAKLTSWQDDSNAAAYDLAASPTREVIFATGQLSGSVVNRDPQSHSERITLKLASPGRAPLDLDITYGSGGQNFTSAADGLLAGHNVITLHAEKPINLVTTGPSEVSVTLQGVLPRDVSLQGHDMQQNGGTVLRRAVGNFDLTFSRAARAQLSYTNPNGSKNLNTYGVNYDLFTATEAVTLDRVTGDHVLQLLAENDFGSAHSAAFSLHAPPPQLTPSFQTSDIPHDPQNPNGVGNSVLLVDVLVTTQFCLNFEISFEGTSFFSVQPQHPFSSENRTITVPSPPSVLSVGPNHFLFSFDNEFAANNTSVTITRRDAVFDVTGSLLIETYDANQVAVVEIVDLEPPGCLNLSVGQQAAGFSVNINSTNSPSAAGFESMRWRILDGDTSDNTDPTTFDFRLSFNAVTIDPDFVRDAVFMMISPSDVDMSDLDSQPFPIILLDDPSGLTITNPPQFWAQAHIIGGTQDFVIPFVTWRLK